MTGNSLKEREIKITGEEVSARREEWVGGRWELKYALGSNSGDLPSMIKGLDVERPGDITGTNLSVDGCGFIVRAFKSHSPESGKIMRHSHL